MSVDHERGLLSAAIRAGDMLPIVNARIGVDDLEDEEYGDVLEWMLDHLQRHGTSPGEDALRINFPTFRLAENTDPIDVYIDAVRDRGRYNLAQEGVTEITPLLERGKTVDALRVFQRVTRESLVDFSDVRDEDITVGPSWQQRIDFYDDLRRTPGQLRGYSTGFRTIDKATRGVQRGQFIMIGGIQKSGKSTLLQRIGITINTQGARILSFNFEMDDDEVKARHDAMRAGVGYQPLLDGRATTRDLRRVRKALEKAEDGYPFVIVTDQENTTTVSGVAAKIDEHKPDVVLLDGVYLMDDEFGESPNSDAALRNISRGIRRLCRRTGVPIIGTSQALESKTTKKVGITAHSMGYTNAFNQDASTTLGLQPLDDPPDSAELRVMLSRSGPKAVSVLTWDWSDMTFEERHGEMSGSQSGPQPAVPGPAPQFTPF